jgi:hypothetical protein
MGCCVMAPQGSAKLYSLGKIANLDNIDYAHLRNYPYAAQSISLTGAGDAFAVLTNGGNYTKVQVVSVSSDLLNLVVQWVTYQGS